MDSITRAGLLLGSAVAVTASFPPLGLEWMALIAWIPFLAALRDTSARQAAVLGLVHGLLVFLGTLNWLIQIFGTMALVLMLILAMFSCLFAYLSVLMERITPSLWIRGFFIALLWTGIEHFRCEWFQLRFPWITPGTALPPNPLTPWIGVYGMTLLVMLAAGWVASGPGRSRQAGIILIIILGLSCHFPRHTPEAGERNIKVAAVQAEGLLFEEILELSHGIDGEVDAILWPEYALNFDIRKHPQKLERIRTLLEDKGASLFIAGSITHHPDETWSNTAILVGIDSILGHHYKNRPVHFFDDGKAGSKAPAWPTPAGIIATPICFDNDYTAVAKEAVTNGAEVLLIPSMDAAHWTARQHLQHAGVVRHRAAENGRWMVIASSSGLTQALDPHGASRESLPLFEPGLLIVDVGLEDRLTIFTRFGWLLGPATTIAAGALTLVMLISQWKKPDSLPSKC